MITRKLSIAITLALLLSTPFTVFAEPVDDLKNQKQGIQQDIDSTKDELTQIVKKLNELQSTIWQLDSQVENIMAEIEETNQSINVAEDNIKKTQIEIDNTKAKIKEQQDTLDERLKYLYINGPQSYIEVLLNSKGIGDFLEQYDAVNQVMAYDKKLINDLEQSKKDLENKTSSLAVEKKKLEVLKSNQEDQKVALDGKKSEASAKVNENKDLQKQLETKIANSNSKIQDIDSEIARINEELARQAEQARQAQAEREAQAARQAQNASQSASASNNNTSTSNNSTSANNATASRGVEATSSYSGNNSDVVAYAKNFLGTPYVWGGTSPSPGFDCSGFVQYVYKNAGINLPRTTYTQIGVGSSVSYNDLQPGDLVFFGSGQPYHVGIYVGGGSYIHSPTSGDVVKISNLGSSYDYMGARRVR